MVEKPMIKIYDACCGSGKTTRLIDDISKLPMEQKVIIVVPLLSETHRYAGTIEDPTDPSSLSNLDYDKNHPLYLRFFQHPLAKNKEGSKLVGLDSLIENGSNVVTTHALFKNLTPTLLSKIQEQNYLLVIDEVLTTYEEYVDLKKEAKQLLDDGIIYLDEDGLTLRWNEKYKGLERYQQEINMCNNGALLLIDKKVVLWEMAKQVLESFSTVWMATYLFEGSYMCGYLHYNDFKFTVEKFGKSGKEFKNLIHIIDDPKLNEIGDKNNALSKNFQMKQTDLMKKVKNNIYNVFHNKFPTTNTNQRLWTCYKVAQTNLSGKGYTTCFLPLGTKATNDYIEAKVLVFIANLFTNPSVDKLLFKKGIKVVEELYALGEMVQWIYRSQIRRGDPIVIYIPSKRMRDILIGWVDGKYD